MRLMHFFYRLPQRLLIGAVRAYQLVLSPWLGGACRFYPTCSAYSLEALQTHGAAVGSYLTLRRIGRCHPLCPGGHDPVPPRRGPAAGVEAASSNSGTLPNLSLTSRKKTLP